MYTINEIRASYGLLPIHGGQFIADPNYFRLQKLCSRLSMISEMQRVEFAPMQL